MVKEYLYSLNALMQLEATVYLSISTSNICRHDSGVVLNSLERVKIASVGSENTKYLSLS